MFSLLRILTIRQLASEQLPALAGSWLIAEFFYKFHSFSLECLAFLATWAVFDAAVQFFKKAFQQSHSSDASTTGM